jgi:hypothetical protein
MPSHASSLPDAKRHARAVHERPRLIVEAMHVDEVPPEMVRLVDMLSEFSTATASE